VRNRNATEEDAIAITSGNKSPAANPSAGRKSERGKMTSDSKTKSEFRVATESIKAPRAAAELHIQGRWSVTVELNNGKQVHEWGEFRELDSSTLVKDQIPLRALSGSNACQAVRLAGAQAYAMKPPEAMRRIPVRRTRPDPCCNHQSMMA